MTQEQLDHCSALIDEGSHLFALTEIICMGREPDADTTALAPLEEQAWEHCGADYETTRQEILRLIRDTESPETIDACFAILTRFGDFSALKSCREIEVKVPEAQYSIGFSDYVDHWCIRSFPMDEIFRAGCITINNAPVRLLYQNGDYLTGIREPGTVTTPRFSNYRRLSLGGRAWAAAYDARTQQYLVTMSVEDEVRVINAQTLETEKVLKSPARGVRGLAIHPEMRRGLFAAEFGNVLFSFNLDTLELGKEITGFSIRPERIYIDPATNIAVTGNLGWSVLGPGAIEIYFYRHKASVENKVSDGESISVVDMEKEEVVQTLPTGRRPTAVGISRKYIAAGNFFDNSVTIYDRSNLSRRTDVKLDLIQDGVLNFTLHDKYADKELEFSKLHRPRVIEGIAILDRRDWILVANFDLCLLSIIDLKTMKVIDSIPVQNAPFDVVVDEREKLAYVPCLQSNQVSVVDLDQRQEICRLDVGNNPQDVFITGGRLLVPDDDGVCIYDIGRLESELKWARGYARR